MEIKDEMMMAGPQRGEAGEGDKKAAEEAACPVPEKVQRLNELRQDFGFLGGLCRCSLGCLFALLPI